MHNMNTGASVVLELISLKVPFAHMMNDRAARTSRSAAVVEMHRETAHAKF